MYDDQSYDRGTGEMEGKEDAASERTADLDPIRLEWVDLSFHSAKI